MANKDIPGFYRDPITGRYFREVPATSGVNPKFNHSSKKIEVPDMLPKPENVASILRKRGLGSYKWSADADNEFLRLKLHKKSLVHTIDLNTVQTRKIFSVDYIKGGEESNFGLWKTMDTNNESRYVLGQLNFDNNGDHPTTKFRLNKFCTDICRGPAGTLICLYNNPFSSCFEYVNIQLHRTPPNRTLYAIEPPFEKSPLFSCCSLVNEDAYAVGGDLFVKLFNHFQLLCTMAMRGRIHTLSYGNTSKELISGIHNGSLFLNDLRTENCEKTVKVSDKCLNDSTFMGNNQVIVADVEGLLAMVDFRQKAVVTTYNDHKHSIRKCPFSVANNLLCATGKDDIIRIWNLAGGNPIHVIRPRISSNPLRGWLYGDGSKTFLNCFEDNFKRVYEIL